jgi:hypothetical protein
MRRLGIRRAVGWGGVGRNSLVWSLDYAAIRSTGYEMRYSYSKLLDLMVVAHLLSMGILIFNPAMADIRPWTS